MKDQYLPPELEPVGSATEVVLGLSGVGFDMLGQDLGQPGDFDIDELS